MMIRKTYMLFLLAGLCLLYGPVNAANMSANPSDHGQYMKGPYPDGIAVTNTYVLGLV